MSKCCSEIVKAMATASTVAGVASGSRRRAPSMTHCLLRTNQTKASLMHGDVYLGGTDPTPEPAASPWQFSVLCRSWMASLFAGETHQPNAVCTWRNVAVPLPSACLPRWLMWPLCLGQGRRNGLPRQKENTPLIILLLFSGTVKIGGGFFCTK